ncbi:substrate-binding periplasmic protein [Alteromonas flava]|uniref:substrate-binding periplasmic protein n=1 Tax=Alteromonas flava TaxID=2048003 RepID=UPI000C28B64A|nr:transporter substrate-binding domain-containing protein [Alteromonas flava]
MRNIICQGLLVICTLVIGSSLCRAAETPPQLRFYSEIVPPYYWLDKDGRPQGAAFELAQALLAETQIDATISHLPWARAIVEARQHPNIVLLTALKTPQRLDSLQWIGKVGVADAHLIGLKNRQLEALDNIDQAKSLRIATIRGYGAANYLMQKGFVEGENLTLFVRVEQLWSMLFLGRVDAVLMNFTTSPFEIIAAGHDPDAVKPLLHIDELTVDLEMATGTKTPVNTVMALQKGLAELKATGQYEQIMARWGLN